MKPFRDDSLFHTTKYKKHDSYQDNMEDEFKAKLKEFDVSIANLFSYLENDEKNNWNVPAFNTEYENTIATWNCEFFPTAGDSTIEALSEIISSKFVNV